MSLPNHFDLLATDGPARAGRLTTPHGVVRTPAFMPIGTAGAMKGMHWRDVRDAGTDIVLGNTYHLMLRPGAERIASLGGLQTFTGWQGPMLTDSGGFQVMSLAQLRKVSESAVTFRSHIDGAKVELSPERDRGAASARLRYRHAARRMRAAAGGARRYRAGDAALAALGRALHACVRDRGPRNHAVRDRAGWRRAGIAPGKRAGPGRHRLSRLRHRRPRGRRTASGDAGDDRGGRADPAAGSPEISDGRRHAGRHARGGGARHRYVRLRHADAQRAPRRGVHAVRSGQFAQRPPRRRSTAARRGKLVAIDAQLRAGVPASPRQVGRDARGHAAVGNQYRILPAPDARHR